jgi:hypothetical protein
MFVFKYNIYETCSIYKCIIELDLYTINIIYVLNKKNLCSEIFIYFVIDLRVFST